MNFVLKFKQYILANSRIRSIKLGTHEYPEHLSKILIIVRYHIIPCHIQYLEKYNNISSLFIYITNDDAL